MFLSLSKYFKLKKDFFLSIRVIKLYVNSNETY